MSSIAHRSIRKISLPRTGRELDAMPGGSSSGGRGASSGGSSSGGSVMDHSLLTGVISTADKYSDSAKDIHLTADDAKGLDRLLNLEIIESTELDTKIPSDENLYSALATDFRINKSLDDFLVDINGMYLRKDIPDTAHENILFDKKIGSSIFIEGYDGKGWEITAPGAALLDSIRVRSDLFIGGRMGSPTFASGFPEGWGWDLSPYTIINSAGMEETRYRLEIDDIVARGSARFYEMIISQLRGENDNVIFSGQMKVAYYDQATGRLYLDTELGILYNPFRHGDLLEVQRYNGMPSADNDYYITKQYELQVEEVGIGSLADGEDRLDWITFKNFVGDLSLIAKGDVLTRVDSATNSTRKGVVKITTIDELGTPHISALYGMKTNPDDYILARMGNCASIRTKSGKQLDETVGFYARGAHLEYSTIVLNTGETIEQTFTAMGGKFESLIGGIRDDMSSQAGNILVNSSFDQNTNYWTLANTVHFINVNSHYLWMDGSFYVDKEAVADIYNDGGQNRLRLRNTYIVQQNALFRLPERTEPSKDGYAYSFSFKYKVLRAGKLSAGFPGTDLYVEQQLSPSEGYQKLSKVAKWNEAGNFELHFTGEILIYAVSLFNDSLADAQIKLQTQIDQTNEYIKLLATKEYVDSETGAIYVHYDSKLQITAEQMSGISTKVDNINNTIESSGWITQAEGTTLFAKKEMEDGKSIVNAINVGTDGILIQANRIQLNGVVSFSMLSDYSTINSRINGKADSSSLGSLAYQDQITKGMMSIALQSELNGKVSSNALGSLAYASSISKNNLANSLLTEFNGKANSSSLKALAYLDKVEQAQLGSTIISGGHIITSLIDTDSIYANQAYLGNFSINNGWLTCNATTGKDVGYIDMRGSGTRIAFGNDLIPGVAGGALTCTAIITNNRTAAFGGTTYALSLKASGNAANDIHAVAVDCEGGVRIRGEFSLIENLYTDVNVNISNSSCSSASNLRSRRTFIFAPAEYISVYLPSDTAIHNEFGYFADGRAVVDHSVIVIKILIAFHASDMINVQSTIGIIDQNGNTIRENNAVSRSNFNMAKGDYAELMYMNRKWYLVNINS